MALTPEQQEQLDFQFAQQAPQQKMELVRLARDVVIQNALSKPVEERDVSADDIIAFATALNTYVNQ